MRVRSIRHRSLAPGVWRVSSAVIVLLLVAACGLVILEPWHGPNVLALSEQHGIDAGDLTGLALVAVAVAVFQARARAARRERGRWAGNRLAAVCAIVLGALLLAGILVPWTGVLVPAGGFNTNVEVDGRHAEPVGRWTNLAVTYDGAILRLYVDGVEASSRPASGTILRTSDPLWIGGDRPYGEYFRGVIDELRVYNRALGPSQVRAAMSTPIARRGGSLSPGLVAAYAFDAGGRTATDASGNGNTGTIRGANWTSAGRFGGGMSFDGVGEAVRVPASASLNLRAAMTLASWIKPSESQTGRRTVVFRQGDAYGLEAGGGRADARLLGTLDRLRFVLEILLVAWIGVALARGHASWASSRRRWYWPVALFVAGSVVDASLAPSNTLIGPALVAFWCGATSSRRDETVCMYVLSAVFAAVTIVSVFDPAPLPLPHDEGGIVRSAALGLLLATAGLLSARRIARDGEDPRALRV
jgi:hypothetical protein